MTPIEAWKLCPMCGARLQATVSKCDSCGENLPVADTPPRLEAFMNMHTEMDWGWWPVLFLRPPKNRDMDNLVLFKMACFFGPVGGILVLLILFALGFALGIRPTIGDVVLWGLVVVFVVCVAFFVLYKFTFAVFWNRRARRLRDLSG